MSNESFVELAVDALADYVDTNLPTYLRALEAEIGLAASAIPDPVAAMRAPLDYRDDNRSPLLMAWDERAHAVEHAAGVQRWDVDCALGIAYTGDADVAAGALMVRRYAVAIRRCLRADPSLGARVSNSLVTDYGVEPDRVGQSLIRHIGAFGVLVRVETL